MASDQAPELEMPDRFWVDDFNRDAALSPVDGWVPVYLTDPTRPGHDGFTEYVRADASPLPPPGSAAEAEMVERALKAFRDAVVSGERMNDGAMLAALRAAFAKGGESDA